MSPGAALAVATLALAASIGQAPSVQAADYHVAVVGDDDTGDGSPGAPWATITHALDTVPDGSTICVGPGDYFGRVRIRGRFAAGVTVRAVPRYRARLRHSGTVFTVFDAQGVTVEGFDVAHDGLGAAGLVVQVQDLIDQPGGPEFTSRITFRDNILHDSFNNDILKINNGAGDVLVEGNLFYNQEGSDEHVDVNSVTNVVLQDNVFFNDFEGSGRANANDTSSFIVIKDSGAGDTNVGSRDITVRRNVFLNWQGSTGSNFVLLGEDGNPFFEAQGVVVENNLMVGNSAETMRAPFGVKGCRDVTFRNNTVVGDFPSLAFAFRFNTEGANLPNEELALHGNVWSDPTGTMEDFSDTPPGQTASYSLDRNLYWNGGQPIPVQAGETINWTDDPRAVEGDPALPGQAGIALPRWNPTAGTFADGSTTIRQVFVRLVEALARPAAGSAVLDAADPALSPSEDILGRPRPSGSGPDLGAYELTSGVLPPAVSLRVARASSTTEITWEAVPDATTYDTYRGTIPAGGLASRGPATYDHACLELGDAQGNGPRLTSDVDPLPPATTGTLYYLVEARSAAGGSGLGAGRPDDAPCR